MPVSPRRLHPAAGAAVAVLVFVTTLATASSQASASGAFSPIDGKLAFAANRPSPNDWRIYVRRPAGGHPTKITSPSWISSSPAWAPDGSALAFVRSVPAGGPKTQLVVTDPAGGDLRVVVDAATAGITDFDRPTWSGDSRALAFTASEPVMGQQVYRVNADGSGLTRVTSLPSYAAPEHPTWSPDGATIAFDAWNGPGEDAITDIFLIGADGSDLRAFTNDHALDFSPAFSPDGTAIAWSRKDRAIVTENLDGTGYRVVTSSNRYYVGDPTWAPAGDWIAFVGSQPACPGCPISFNIFVMRTSGQDLHPVTHTSGIVYLSPTWRRSAARASA